MSEWQMEAVNRRLPAGYLLQPVSVRKCSRKGQKNRPPPRVPTKRAASRTPTSPLGLILAALQSHPAAGPFQKPVDLKYYTDYTDFVSEPIDLKTVQKKLAQGKYKRTDDFAGDIRKIWSNAFMYNRRGSDVYEMAKMMSLYSEELIKPYQFPPRFSRSRSNRLVQDIQTLSSQDLEGIFTIVEPEMTTKDGLLELQFDVEKLSTEVFISLERYVEYCKGQTFSAMSTAASTSSTSSPATHLRGSREGAEGRSRSRAVEMSH